MSDNGTALDELLKSSLETVEGLIDRVCPVADIQKSSGPLAIYDQQDESEEDAIDGLTGLASSVFKIHVLHGTYERMRLLSERVKSAILGMRQRVEGSLFVEGVTVKLASPDIYEDRVQLYRRSYQVTIQYQFKEEQ